MARVDAVAGKAVAGQQKPEGFPRRLLGLDAEAAELLVVQFGQAVKHAAGRGAAGGTPPGRWGGGRAGFGGGDFPGGNLLQEGHHFVGRCVWAAGQETAIAGQKGHRRKAALVVAEGDVGTLVHVHAHGDEPGVDQRDYPVVGIGQVVHDVAPVAPGGAQGQEHRLALGPGRGKG